MPGRVGKGGREGGRRGREGRITSRVEVLAARGGIVLSKEAFARAPTVALAMAAPREAGVDVLGKMWVDVPPVLMARGRALRGKGGERRCARVLCWLY